MKSVFWIALLRGLYQPPETCRLEAAWESTGEEGWPAATKRTPGLCWEDRKGVFEREFNLLLHKNET